jgi:malate dehydrogenase (oxaloacetate-decarboxylating)(NADP+)
LSPSPPRRQFCRRISETHRRVWAWRSRRASHGWSWKKAALFKRFADIDSIDLEIDTRDVDEFVNCVRFLHPAFGGINLEDIKAPECFIIEERLRELLDIPVFHDDQHGTAIIATAGLINALNLTGRTLDRTKMVVNGAGAASIACVEL